MNTFHHPHLMATDIDATIAFWRDGFGGRVVADVEFAGARNVFVRVGRGRLHLYDQPPLSTARGTVTSACRPPTSTSSSPRLRGMGVSVTDVRHQPRAAYAMAEGPDGLLVELLQPDLDDLDPALRDHFDTTA